MSKPFLSLDNAIGRYVTRAGATELTEEREVESDVSAVKCEKLEQARCRTALQSECV